jgi:hypothetical protein
MYLDKGPIGGKPYDNPKIKWHEEDKYAIIAFLRLSIDKKADKDGMVRLDDLFDLNETASEPAGEETKDTIISECEMFLAGLEDDERYDIIQDEIDKFIEGKDGDNAQCTIGDSYRTFGSSSRQNRFYDGKYRLWELVKLVVSDADYQGNKRRLLKHLSRKWDIDGSVLPALEDAAKTLSAISRERRELTESDKSFREVTNLLAELETREKETWKALYAIGIREDRTRSEQAEILKRLGNTSLEEYEKSILDKLAEQDEENGKNGYNLGDAIIAKVCDGIASVGWKIADGLDYFNEKLGKLIE